MSTRWYPLYQKGNPQLRVFLPNFWMKLVEPERKQPKNVVQFHCSMEMTIYDVKNYLEKIYNVHPLNVRTRIAPRVLKIKDTLPVKENDVKIAYVVLPKDQPFVFPKLFDTAQDDDLEKDLERAQETLGDHIKYSKYGMSGWFRTH